MAAIIRHSASNTMQLLHGTIIELLPEEKHPDWVRWVHASVNKHFLTNKGSLPMYLEGDERTFQDEAEFYELRIDGPFIFQPQKYEYILDFEINTRPSTHGCTEAL